MPVVGIVAALPAEAGAAAGAGAWRRIDGWPVNYSSVHNCTIICISSGPGIPRAAAAATVLLSLHPDLLVSTGVAGGLSPDLPPGALVIADSVLELHAEQGTHNLRTAWACAQNRNDAIRGIFSRAGLQARSGQMLTSREPVPDGSGKKALHQQTASLSVDMESAAVAAIAVKAGLPFFALRAVCDTSGQAVPPELYQCLQDDGRIGYSRIIKNVLKRPQLLKELLALGLNYKRALASLKKAWGVIFQNDLCLMLMRRQ